MGLADSHGMTVAPMKVNTLLTRSMAEENSAGQMAESTTDSGRMGDSMESDPTLPLTGALGRVSGSTANVSNGWELLTTYQDILLSKRVVL